MTLKERLLGGEGILATWLTVASPAIGELLGLTGFGCVAIDAEHGAIDLGEAENLIRAVEAGGAAPLLRVAGLDQVLIKRALDLGPAGVIIPLVSTREAAEAAVRFAKYPPQGVRGVGVGRAQAYGLDLAGYLGRANREGLVVVQVEDRGALQNLDEILSVPGVDMVFIGPVDLSTSLGFPGQPDHPVVDEANARVLAAAKAAGRLAGIHASDATVARRRLEQGFRLVTVATDTVLLARAGQAVLTQVRG